MFHDQVGHPGMNATSIAIQKYYMWKGMHAEIVEYVSSLYIIQWIPLNVGTSVQHVSSTLSGCPDYPK